MVCFLPDGCSGGVVVLVCVVTIGVVLVGVVPVGVVAVVNEPVDCDGSLTKPSPVTK